MVAAGLHNTIRIWDVDKKNPIDDLQQSGEIVSLVFSGDGKWLATGSSEGTIILWEVNGTTISQKSTLQMSGIPRAIAFSSDDRWLASGSSLGFAYLLDVAIMQEITRIPHDNPVTSVAFSMDGTQLLTVSRKVVRIWNVSALPKVAKDKLISSVCSHLVKNLSREDWEANIGNEEYQLFAPICLYPKTLDSLLNLK